MFKRNIIAVERFIEKKGGCDGAVGELYNEFQSGKYGFNKNFLKSITRKQFELALLRVCIHNNGKVIYDNNFDKRIRNKRYIITVVMGPQRINGTLEVVKNT